MFSLVFDDSIFVSYYFYSICITKVFPFPQVIGFGSVKIAAFIAMVGILSIVAQVSVISAIFFFIIFIWK